MDFNFGSRIEPACLPRVDMCLSIGTELEVTGWGETIANSGNLRRRRRQGGETVGKIPADGDRRPSRRKKHRPPSRPAEGGSDGFFYYNRPTVFWMDFGYFLIKLRQFL